MLGVMVALSGCSSLGGFGFDSGATAALANNPAFTPAPAGSPRPTVFTGLGLGGGDTASAYLPPAPVGSGSSTVLRPPGSVASQDLPVLSSNVRESNPMMTAAQPVSPATAPLAAPQDNLVALPSDAYVHIVQSGESLYTIARHYNVTAQSIIQANGFSSPDRLFVGQRLMIPGRADLVGRDATVASADTLAPAEGVLAPPAGTLSAPVPVEKRPQVAELKTPVAVPEATPQAITDAPLAKAPQGEPTPSGADKFRWPVSGRVITDFAASKGTGINIEAPEGTTVRAAENGQVIYAGSGVEGYGNLVLIRHANGYVSAYAHLAQINVQKGTTVNRGDAIGTAGMTGGVSKPQLHFEIRKGATPVDPVPLLAG
jgi:murein DD-endopeptidase MepM/ murein hydrolase activator NlpD